VKGKKQKRGGQRRFSFPQGRGEGRKGIRGIKKVGKGGAPALNSAPERRGKNLLRLFSDTEGERGEGEN